MQVFSLRPDRFKSSATSRAWHEQSTATAGARFLDSVSCDGPIPDMVDQAVRAVIRTMTRAAHVTGVGRRDRNEYPVEVIRELIVNAVRAEMIRAGRLPE